MMMWVEIKNFKDKKNPTTITTEVNRGTYPIVGLIL